MARNAGEADIDMACRPGSTDSTNAKEHRHAVDKAPFAARKARYHEIRKGYTPEEFMRFPKMLGMLALAMEEAGFDDVLGGLYMELGLGNARGGQFFTPYTVSRMMALMMVGEYPVLPPHGFIDAIEPACGAGGMVVALADALHEADVNYQRRLHVTCIDIDLRCVHMTYLQASLLHIPAVVVHGNALSGEEWGRWYTLAQVLGDWERRRLAAQCRLGGDGGRPLPT